MNTKRNVFFIGVIGSVLLVLPAILNQMSSCYQESWFFCSESYEIVAILALPFLFVLLLSLITYFMRDEVFRAWWGFARWWVPVIIVVTYLLNSANSGGGLGIGGAVSSAFDILIIGILYAVLIITSLIKITQAYFRSKTT